MYICNRIRQPYDFFLMWPRVSLQIAHYPIDGEKAWSSINYSILSSELSYGLFQLVFSVSHVRKESKDTMLCYLGLNVF
jgi:hypothetical protein